MLWRIDKPIDVFFLVFFFILWAEKKAKANIRIKGSKSTCWPLLSFADTWGLTGHTRGDEPTHGVNSLQLIQAGGRRSIGTVLDRPKFVGRNANLNPNPKATQNPNTHPTRPEAYVKKPRNL